jgi:FtsH-binding integral membrane protein
LEAIMMERDAPEPGQRPGNSAIGWIVGLSVGAALGYLGAAAAFVASDKKTVIRAAGVALAVVALWSPFAAKRLLPTQARSAWSFLLGFSVGLGVTAVVVAWLFSEVAEHGILPDD